MYPDDLDRDNEFNECDGMFMCPYRQLFPGPFTPPIGGPGGPGGPGFGGPPGFGGGPDFDGPPGMEPPDGPPPAAVPQKSAQIKAVDPGAIRYCRFKYTYIWLTNGREFWAYLTYVGRRSVSGWRWTGFYWVYFGIDTRRIDSFVCY